MTSLLSGLKEALPNNILEAIIRVGKVEWGATATKPDAAHLEGFANSLKITRENFALEGDQSLQGVYIEGTETVICHTGTSPNSAQHARIIVGLWNSLVDRAIAAEEARLASAGEGV